MKFTARIDEAVRLASRLHRNQTRRDSEKTPYISHLVSVAMMLSEYTDDEDIIIAGLMHDSLEDVPNYKYKNLVEDCGVRVADIVKHVTEPLDANKEADEQLPWLFRQEEYLKNLRTGGVESAMVSAVDKIHNTRSIITGAENEKLNFISRFRSSFKNKLWLDEQVLLIVEEKLGIENTLVKNLADSTEEFRTLVTSFEN